MKRKIVSLMMALVIVFSASIAVAAENEKITSDTFTVHVKVLEPDGELQQSTLDFNLFTEAGEWLGYETADITEIEDLSITFNVPVYEIGAKFILMPSAGVTYIDYCGTNYEINDEILIETYAYRDSNDELVVSDEVHVSAYPFYTVVDQWEIGAEKHVNEKQIWSDTPYLIWVSKKNFTVSVFLREDGEWNCIKYFGCSIGAPGTPTITGQFTYHQYQTKWDYGSYYVGPIMRFYGGYAIHSTLVNNNGTDRDGRIGKMISHGCVRVRPENINWLTYYVPLGTKIYITEE